MTLGPPARLLYRLVIQSEKLGNKVKKMKWHILKLEQVKRLLENDDLEPSALDEVKEDVDFFVEVIESTTAGSFSVTGGRSLLPMTTAARRWRKCSSTMCTSR